MNEAGALKLVRAIRGTLAGLDRLDDELVHVAALTEKRADLETEVHTLTVRQRDLTAAVASAERRLAERGADVARETASLGVQLATTRNRLEGEMATARREHNAHIKAMQLNEAKVKAEQADTVD